MVTVAAGGVAATTTWPLAAQLFSSFFSFTLPPASAQATT